MQQFLKSYLRNNLGLFSKLALLALLYGLAMPVFSTEYYDDDEYRSTWFDRKVVKVDVVEDQTRFTFDEAPVFDNGFPKAGNAFITHGYIYPEGFLDEGQAGVDEHGKPVRPDLVIGEWSCRGYFIGDGANTTKGPWIMSTQTFEFYDKPGYYTNQEREYGKRMIFTEGYELVDVNKKVHRGITGGTGRYCTTKGEQIQTSLGFGDFMNVKSRHTLKLRRW